VLKNPMLGAQSARQKHGIARDLEDVYALFPVLKERGPQQTGTLWGGQQQMLAIGRALVGRPTLLLIDEPSVGIAHRLKVEIFESIRAIRGAGTAMLRVEQDSRSALAIADRIYVREQGRFAREGTPKDLVADAEIRRVYLGG
jgi:branched-chain amino acid transport system ATP-binding protein